MSAAEDFLITDAERRLRRTKRRRLLLAGLSLVLVLVLLLVLGRPAAHAIKAWQARRHAERAFALIDAQKWSEAQQESTVAYQLSPNEPEAIRAVARFLSRVRQPEALEFWERLARKQPLTREDLRDEAAVALALGETGRASDAVEALLEQKGHEATPGDWLLAAQLAAQRGAPNEASAALEHAAAEGKARAEEQLRAAVTQLRLGSADAEADQHRRRQAWQWIEKLAKGKDAVGLQALVLLAQRELTGGMTAGSSDSPELGRRKTDGTAPVPPATGSVSALAEALNNHPLAKAPQQLLALDLQIHATPDGKEALIRSAIARYRNGETESLVALATWLNGKGEYERELATIPQDRAVGQKELFRQRLDALGALGRWDKIKEALQSESYPLETMVARMYLARCNQQLGEMTAAENNWRRALEAAGSDTAKLMTLADYATKNGATAIAGRAYDAAIAAAPKSRAAWQGKLGLAQASRDTRTIHAVLAGMLKRWPKDPAIRNDEAYTRLLLAGAEKAETLKPEKLKSEAGSTALASASPPSANQLSEIERLAQELVQRNPTSLPHRTLLALVYLKENRTATALGVYENLNVPRNALTPSALAVHAAVLAANGNTAEAEKEAAQVPPAALLPEEAEFLQTLKR